MTDADTTVLPLLKHNIDLNLTCWRAQRKEKELTETEPQSLHALQLVWGEEEAIEKLLREQTEERREEEAVSDGGFQVIVAADIIYHMTDFEGLGCTVQRLLSKSDPWAVFILAFHERVYGHHAQLRKEMDSIGMERWEVDIDVSVEAYPLPSITMINKEEKGDRTQESRLPTDMNVLLEVFVKKDTIKDESNRTRLEELFGRTKKKHKEEGEGEEEDQSVDPLHIYNTEGLFQ
ncbi:hypothetical protein QOT17_000869 [Balamuthia mandrillaris]